MNNESVLTAPAGESRIRRFGRWLRKWAGLLFSSPSGTIGFIILMIVVLASVFAPLLSPWDPAKQNIVEKLIPPFWCERGVPEHILGTDSLGRDVLTRCIYGARVSLLVGICSVIVAGVITAFGYGTVFTNIQSLGMRNVRPSRRGVSANTLYAGMDAGTLLAGPFSGAVCEYFYGRHGDMALAYAGVYQVMVIPIVLGLLVYFLDIKRARPAYAEEAAENT